MLCVVLSRHQLLKTRRVSVFPVGLVTELGVNSVRVVLSRHQLLKTRRVSVFPVGLMTELGVSSVRVVLSRHQLLKTRRVSVFPVGLVTELGVSSVSVVLSRHQLLKTRRVSVFPVGLVTELGVSSPVVQDGRVVAFFDGWSGGRLFAMDMAGFAVSIELLKQVMRQLTRDINFGCHRLCPVRSNTLVVCNQSACSVWTRGSRSSPTHPSTPPLHGNALVRLGTTLTDED